MMPFAPNVTCAHAEPESADAYDSAAGHQGLRGEREVALALDDDVVVDVASESRAAGRPGTRRA